MESSTKDILSRLGRGPAVLFLGQRHLALASGEDPLLAQVATKYERDRLDGYDDLLQLGLGENAEASLAWLDERCRRIPLPAPLEELSDFAWSAVVTSAIDTVWPGGFRKPWRELQPVLDERYRPGDPRNRSRLHCLFLFGNVNRTDPRERVPLSPFERLQRYQIAQALARRIPELVTPLGTLLIEGYAGNRDWLAPEALAPILADLNPGQAHFFDTAGDLATDPILAELDRRGIAVFHQGSVAAALATGVEAGLIRLGPSDAGGDLHQIQIEEDVLRVPNALWNRVRTSATILDDAALVTPPPLSKDARYRDFRTFLGEGDGIPNWEALGRGFAFRRHFENGLKAVVDRALASPGSQEHPIVLHGPTGSGKTVALASLARRVRLEHHHPVLYVERRAQEPNYGDFDLFCEWVEHEGAPATLIAWDGMLDHGKYHDALRYLQSRGRNVTIVGTSYRVPDEQARGRRFIGAPAQLTPAERTEFFAFLRGFDAGLDQLIERQEAANDSFLVALYRLLPPVRGTVRAGVTREVRHAEEKMARSAADTETDYRPRNQLARALFDAGLLSMEGLSTQAEREIGSELVDDFQHLTGLVMIPGRFGLRLPLELLLRALGHDGFAHFLDLLSGVDIFRWYEDAAGNIEIGARSSLEASLIAEARAGGAETEAAIVRALLLELRQDEQTPWGGREVDFAVSLLGAVEPGSNDTIFSGNYFAYFADALHDLRMTRGVTNPRLMLQEGHYRREFARYVSARRADQEEEIAAALDAAETVVTSALELLPDEQRNKGLRSMLLVELASTMGTRSTQLINRGGNGNLDARSIMIALREVVRRARAEDPTGYHPVDVLAWTTRNAINGGVLQGADKLDAITDVLSAFQSTEVEELAPKQIDQFHARRFEIGLLIKDTDMTDAAEEALRERGSGAALFLRGLIASGMLGRSDGAELDRAQVAAAVELLEADEELLWADSRCLDLYLDLWWTARTGNRLFVGERLTPGLRREQWTRFVQIVEALQHDATTRRPAVLGFLRGLALFHLDRYGEAHTTFKDVEHSSMAVRSRRRVIRTYLASNADGTPKIYHGTVAWIDHNGRKGDIQIEELRTRIVFFPHDFRLDDVRLGLDMGNFHVAFNFLGPIADPVIFR